MPKGAQRRAGLGGRRDGLFHVYLNVNGLLLLQPSILTRYLRGINRGPCTRRDEVAITVLLCISALLPLPLGTSDPPTRDL